MTFLEAQTLTADMLDDTQFAYFSRTVVKLRLNLAQRELQGLLVKAGHDYYTKCVQTSTVIDQKVYALPTDFYAISRLEWITQGTGATASTQQIIRITPNQRDLICATSGDPQYYYFQKNNLIINPVPNRVVSIHLEYSPQVQDMVSDGDSPDAPEQFHEFIPVLAAKKCFIKDGRPIGPIKDDLDRLELELEKIADVREQDAPRMILMTEADYW